MATAIKFGNTKLSTDGTTTSIYSGAQLGWVESSGIQDKSNYVLDGNGLEFDDANPVNIGSTVTADGGELVRFIQANETKLQLSSAGVAMLAPTTITNITGDTTCDSNLRAVGRMVAEKQLDIDVDGAGASPTLGYVTTYVKAGNYIIAYNNGLGTTHYRWFELSATDDPVLWNYATSEPT